MSKILKVTATVPLQDESYSDGTTTGFTDASFSASGNTNLRTISINSNKSLWMGYNGGPAGTSHYILDHFGNTQPLQSFTANFSICIEDDASRGDGISFNFGKLPADPKSAGSTENGAMFNAGANPGITVGWELYSSQEVRAYQNGSSIGLHTAGPAVGYTIFNFYAASIAWSAETQKLSITYAGQTTEHNTAGLTPDTDWGFAFAARTGLQYSNMFLDDINVTAVPEPSSIALLGLGSLALLCRRRRYA